MSDPVVSVHMITYNQEIYIAQAIEGVMMQKTNFQVELVIGEDCSKDRTRDIIQEYSVRYPGRIRLLPEGPNLGMMANTFRTMYACTGKYVAMCEGDDYWTDENKLQKQYDFMEANPDCSLCYHAVDHKFPDGVGDFVQQDYPESKWVGIDEVIGKGEAFIPTASMFYRRVYIERLPDWMLNAVIGDYVLTVLLAINGKVRYMSDVMGVYRRAAIGSWTSNWDWRRQKQMISRNNHMLLQVNKSTGGKYFPLIARVVTGRSWGVFKAMVYARLMALNRFIKSKPDVRKAVS